MSQEILAEIELEAKKAIDCLWHACEAMAYRSPGQRDFEIRRCNESLNKIVDLASHE